MRPEWSIRILAGKDRPWLAEERELVEDLTGLIEQWFAVGCGAGDEFEFATAEQLLDLGLAAGPSSHDQCSFLPLARRPVRELPRMDLT